MDLNEYFTEKASERELFTTGCYLTDGIFLVLKKTFYIKNILIGFSHKIKKQSTFQLKEHIGKGKGKPFTFNKLIFWENDLAKPIIDYNEKYGFDYKLLLMVLETFGSEQLNLFVSKNKKREPILKIYRKKQLLALFPAVEK